MRITIRNDDYEIVSVDWSHPTVTVLEVKRIGSGQMRRFMNKYSSSKNPVFPAQGAGGGSCPEKDGPGWDKCVLSHQTWADQSFSGLIQGD
jgi:hypothetical protein